eukprot:m.281219 g.281219  ORF g.281219 m.281219 type:complete len:580 (+) comp11106_c4_seq3:877-2616(+)
MAHSLRTYARVRALRSRTLSLPAPCALAVVALVALFVVPCAHADRCPPHSTIGTDSDGHLLVCPSEGQDLYLGGGVSERIGELELEAENKISRADHDDEVRLDGKHWKELYRELSAKVDDNADCNARLAALNETLNKVMECAALGRAWDFNSKQCEYVPVQAFEGPCSEAPGPGVFFHTVEDGTRVRIVCEEYDDKLFTVMQRRISAVENFQRPWLDYAKGFGDILNNMWLGNDVLRKMTKDNPHRLVVVLHDFDGNTAQADYSHFSVGPSSEKYQLDIRGFDPAKSSAGDSLSYHNGHQFSTYDQDTDSSCAASYKGGWWYNACHVSNLNGLFYEGMYGPVPSRHADGIDWYAWKGYFYSLRSTMLLTAYPKLTNCQEALQSGLYMIQNIQHMPVYCEVDSTGLRWTVFQRRVSTAVSFERNYKSYQTGFGAMNLDGWLGLDALRTLAGTQTILRIDLKDHLGEMAYAEYGNFSVGDAASGYVLSVSNYSGTAGDSLIGVHNGRPWSTMDQGPSSSCAAFNKGGWWYASCYTSNLNGIYHGGPHENAGGIHWQSWRGLNVSLDSIMKIRPAQAPVPLS